MPTIETEKGSYDLMQDLSAEAVEAVKAGLGTQAYGSVRLSLESLPEETRKALTERIQTAYNLHEQSYVPEDKFTGADKAWREVVEGWANGVIDARNDHKESQG